MKRVFLACCLPLVLAASSASGKGPVGSAELPPLPAPSAAPASAPAPAPGSAPAPASDSAPPSAPGSAPAPDSANVVVLQAPTLATHDAPTLDNPPPPRRSFYESGWFWGAVGAAAVIGGAIYLATQDSGAQTIHLQVQVPH
jgi:hypothetical protein